MERLSKLKRNEQIDQLNQQALAVAAGHGDKKANEQIKKINRELQNEKQLDELKNAAGSVKLANNLKDDQLKKLV